MRRQNAILRALAVAASVIALSGAALASDNIDLSGSVDSDASGTAAAHAASSKHANAAANVTATDHTTANASKHDEDTHPDTDLEESPSVKISPSEQVRESGTSGARPGWGCGDSNHVHSGPPGRPGATPPPGCAGHD